MKTTSINPTTTYRNNDDRLGNPGKYLGSDILKQIAIFGEDCDGTEDWDIREINPAAVALGSIRSPRKAETARENGKKGGRPPITDAAMLRAAERRLAEHLALRPATSAELLAMAEKEEAEAALILSSPEKRTPTISEVVVSGQPGGERINAMLGVAENQRVKGMMTAKSIAKDHHNRARALRDAASLGDGEQYKKTLVELTERRDYYASLVASRKLDTSPKQV